MFLLTTEPARARSVLNHMVDSLPIDAGQVHEVPMGSHRLLWVRAQVRDNLHVYDDGAFIGRWSASEALSDSPIVHHEQLPRTADPVLGGVLIRRHPTLTVEPLGITSVLHCGSTLSDRQLLLAALHRLSPSPTGVAVLAGVGYFTGNLTLFDEVRRVPFLERWDVAAAVGTLARQLDTPRPDDDAMVERLISLVPTDASHALGLSGGYDSRFVLGILQQAGADVRLVRFTDGESHVALAVAEHLGLQVTGIGQFADSDGERTPHEFTLLTDAQIWHGVAQHGRLRSGLDAQDLFHSGHFSPSMNKNTFRTAWKKPDPRTKYWDRLVKEAFLPNIPSVQPTLRDCATRPEVSEIIAASLEYQRHYVDFRSRKAWANWLYYMNRAMRWGQAFYDDLSFSTNLYYLLGDVDSQVMGIATNFWVNFDNERVARLNHRLLPTIDIPYADGRPVVPSSGPRGAWNKLEYEYLTRLRTSRTARAKLQAIPTTYEEALPEREPAGFDRLFDLPMREVATSGRFGLRRANVTVANVLTYLESVPVA